MKWLLLLFPCLLFGDLNDNGDFQVWNTDSIRLQLSRKAYMTGQTEFRYGRDGTKIYYKHYQGGLLYVYSPQAVFEVAYRHIFLRNNNHWRKIYSPLADMTLQVQSRRGFYLGDRSRIQYLIFDKHLGGKHRWLYRNRLEIIPALRISKRKIAPYFAEEFFWMESRGISENRLEFGLKIPYHQRTQLSLSYMYRNFKLFITNKWVQHNVTWVHFSLHF